MTYRCEVIAALALPLLSGVASAQGTLPNDADNFQGDRISFAYDLHGISRHEGGTEAKKICIRSGVSLRVIGREESSKSLIVTFIQDPASNACGEPDKGGRRLPDEEEGKLGVAYLVPTETVTMTPPNRFGLSFGALAIPFKYQLTGDHNMSGSATLGGYIGRRFDKSSTGGFSIEPILFAGASTVSVSQPGSDAMQDVSGVSWGIGLVGTIKGSFQAGVVLGWDRVSKSSQYQYNNKPWLALEIGFTFLQ
jgi:hypothetical protein